MVKVNDARRIVADLPRNYEVLVRGRVKFRVGQLVFASFSMDEKVMGFGFPKEQRDLLIASEPDKFLLPTASDLRFNWVLVRLEKLDRDELHELLVDAWRMVVPKSVAASYADPKLESR